MKVANVVEISVQPREIEFCKKLFDGDWREFAHVSFVSSNEQREGEGE
jgi:hypothetical protein